MLFPKLFDDALLFLSVNDVNYIIGKQGTWRNSLANILVDVSNKEVIFHLHKKVLKTKKISFFYSNTSDKNEPLNDHSSNGGTLFHFQNKYTISNNFRKPEILVLACFCFYRCFD